MRSRHQLALGLFDEDHPPPYPEEPSAIVVSVSGGLDSDYAALAQSPNYPLARAPRANGLARHAHTP
jgi:hypothetical protein